jgi:hypothetical protein
MNTQVRATRSFKARHQSAWPWRISDRPVITADDLSLVNGTGHRAATSSWTAAGGTFTITSPAYGGLFGTPIINQPQVAILGVGAIVKRPTVQSSEDGDDYIAIRSMAYFAHLDHDHRRPTPRVLAIYFQRA